MKITLELNIIENEKGEESRFINFWNAIDGNDVTGEVLYGGQTHKDMILVNKELLSLKQFINQVKKSFVQSHE